jgi:acyl-CoA thioester hydrolase
MSGYKFFHPIEVRYGDLDPQGHLNNAKFLTYFEQARVHYFVQLGLFSLQQSFMDIGVIVADIHIKYRAPVLWGEPVKAGVLAAKIGTKSITLEQCVTDESTEHLYADGTVILVSYDYHEHRTIPVPAAWRDKISQFEGLQSTAAQNSRSH